MSTDHEADVLVVLREHAGFISRIAGSYERDPSLRQDLMQDISISVWRAWTSFRGDASPRTFIARIAHCRGVDHIAAARRHSTGGTALDEALADPGPDPSTVAERQDIGRWLAANVRRLPLAYRQSLVLALEGMSQREIGEALGIEENTVAQRISRARKQLRQWREDMR